MSLSDDVPRPVDKPMPKEPDWLEPLHPLKSWFAGCSIHQAPDGSYPSAQVLMDGILQWALLEFHHPGLSSHPLADPLSQDSLDVMCIFGNFHQVLASEVMLCDGHQKWLLLVGIIPDLPVPLLVGRDWSGFLKPTPELQPRNRAPDQCRRHPWVALAAEKDKEAIDVKGELPSPATNVFHSLSKQVSKKGNFRL